MELGIGEVRSIRNHLSKLTADNIIVPGDDTLVMGKVTMREMRQELTYSLADSFSGMFRALTLTEKADMKYLKKLVFSDFFTKFITDTFYIESFREIEPELQKLFKYEQAVNDEFKLPDRMLNVYSEIYERFIQVAEDLNRSLINVSLTFP
ncbi:MAG: hypothetical protein QXQ46_04410 [Thermoplasmatales archaeon]